HGTMESYTSAKTNILRYQTERDVAVLGYDDSGSYGLQEDIRGDLMWFSSGGMVSDGAFSMGRRLMLVGEANPAGGAAMICERDEIPLRGDHNVLNVLAACAAAGAVGVSVDAMRDTVMTFSGVAHRLELVRELDDVSYINDSIATAPERVLAALKSYEEPLVLLLGGADKKLPWGEMLQVAVRKSRKIIAFGGNAADIAVQTLAEMDASEIVERVETLEEAVAAARLAAKAGDVVLLSPGGTSYDAYTDFAARGVHFRELIGAL
ncbi:MAG: cyanophycin synthetase, partial [Chloroflexota bacterium]